MKFMKLSFAAAVAVLVFGTVTASRAINVPDGTYAFYATDGDTALDGSSITFLNDQVVSWNLVDTAETGTSIPPSTNPLTPDNSQLDPNDIYAGVYGPNQWAFDFVSLTPGINYYDFFEADNNLEGPGGGGGVGRLYDGYGDPAGNWGPAQSAAVPDASSTLGLMMATLTALGACKSFLRGRAALQR